MHRPAVDRSPLGPAGPSTALLTDRYELTMLDAALRSGVAARRAVFEVFTRAIPAGRRFGVFAGLGPLLDAVERFRFGPPELDWLAAEGIVSADTLGWLAGHSFAGSIDAYSEGEPYSAGSPVLTVEGSFGEAVLLETLVLSVLNHDSAVASAAALIVEAAGGRPVIEMGSRRTDPAAAVAAARAAYICGFASTSNLEAGRRYGIPTAGTVAHAFVLAHPSEREAFRAQVASLGPGTTLLVDTFDPAGGIANAVAAAGDGLDAVRIDSGDLVAETWRARRLLDDLGAAATRIVVTGDLDTHALAALADAPADSYGVGTNLVTGLGHPTAGFVYKLVAVGDDHGDLRPVAKQSPGKSDVGGRKWAWRIREPGWADLVATDVKPPPGPNRALQSRVVEDGRVVRRAAVHEARELHRAAVGEIPPGEHLVAYLRGGPDRPGRGATVTPSP
ncbi:MAG: nicotinate phosphoribosyltransferase [Acidimicrobiales bacterium]